MPRSRLPPPPVDYIERRAKIAQDRDSKRNEHFDEIEQLRFRKHEVPLPEAFRRFGRTLRTPLVDDVLRVVTTGIQKSFPRFVQPPQSDDRQDQDNSSRIEKWLNAIYPELDRGGGKHRAYVDAIDNAATYGLGVQKLLYLPDAWDNDYLRQRKKEPDGDYLKRKDAYMKGAPLPFAWLTPDPRTYHDWTHYRRLVEVIETSERTRDDIAARFQGDGVKFDTQSGRLYSAKYTEPVAESALSTTGGLGTKVQFKEHWNLDYGTYTADGVLLRRVEPRYNRLPYFPFFGLSTASTDPRYEQSSVVENMLELVQTLDIAATIWINHGILAALPMGTYTQPEGSSSLVDTEGKVLDTIQFEPGVFKVTIAGGQLTWITAPQVGDDIKALTDLLLSMAREAGAIPDVLRGIHEKSATAWGQAQQLMVATRRVFDPITDNCSAALTDMARFILWLAEHRHVDPIYVLTDSQTPKGPRKRWLGLEPGHIKGYYAVIVEIATLTEDKRIQEAQLGIQLQQAGAIDMQTLREEYLHYAAPEELDRRVRREKFRNSDQYSERLWQQFLAVLGEAMGPQEGEPEVPPEGQMPPEQGVLPPGVPPEGMPPAGLPPGQAPPPGPQPIAGVPNQMAPTPGLGLPLTLPEQTRPVVT